MKAVNEIDRWDLVQICLCFSSAFVFLPSGSSFFSPLLSAACARSTS